MTVYQLIDKLNALPDKQKQQQVAFIDDYLNYHDIDTYLRFLNDKVWLCEYSDAEIGIAIDIT